MVKNAGFVSVLLLVILTYINVRTTNLHVHAARLPSFKSHDDSEISTSDKQNAKIGSPITNALRSNVLGYLQDVVQGVDEVTNITRPSSESQVKKQAGGSTKRKALCTACKFLIHSVRWASKIGIPRSFLFGVIQEGCIQFSGKTSRVCVGLISTFKDDVPMLLSTSKNSAVEICSTFFSACPPGRGGENKSRLNFDVILPVSRQKLSVGGSGGAVPHTLMFGGTQKTLRVLHLADIHVDLLYKIGSDAVCREPQCCRDGDSGTGDAPKAGYWGFNGGFCDTPAHLLDAMFAHIARTQKIDFILNTGDAVPHDVWNQSRAYQLNVTATANAAVRRHFPKIPVYSTLGNHESYPVNSFPQPFVKGQNNISWLYASTAKQWIGWGPDESQRPSIEMGGYYAQRPPGVPGLKIISLNTNYCSKLNWWLLLNNDDPAGQMAWLVTQLSESEQRGESVYIISHISPTGDKCIKPWRNNYYKIVARFKDTIRGTFFGHSHFDEFGVTYDPADTSQPTSVAFIAPSITTYRYLNPSYRVFSVEGGTNKLLDFETFIANLTDSNAKAAKRPNGIGDPTEDLQWRLEYSARKQYSLPDLSPESWSRLSMRLRNEPALFKIYYDNYYKQQEHWTQKVCEGKCRETLLCNTMSNACTDGDGILLW